VGILLRRDARGAAPGSHRLLLLASGSAVVVVLSLLVVLSGPAQAVTPGPVGPPRHDTSPVNLSTPVDMANGLAQQSAVVRSGGARIEVLTPTLLRLEYSPSGTYENRPTVNAINRRMAVPKYTAQVSHGWLTVQTSRATLRYKVGSGPFTTANTSLRLAVGDQMSTVHPTWEWECPFGQTCQTGAAVLGGGASLSQVQGGYLSTAGYAGSLNQQGAGATWSVLGAPTGPAAVSIRYSNLAGGPQATVPRTISLVVNGQLATTLTAMPTDSANPWSTVTTTAPLQSGSNSVAVVCGSGDSCGVDIDTLAVGAVGTPASPVVPAGSLGGWVRGFDTFTYGPGTTCPPGTGGDTCQAVLEPLHTDGLLDTAGWRLVDDTRTATWTPQGWVQARSPGGDVQDGYLFAYGHDYAGALRTLAQLTGSAPLLPRNVFGVWYSDYHAYTSSVIQDQLYPAFQADQVPLNTLSLDTDWKAPNSWDGWEWNNTLFPQPGSFLNWARSHGVDVTLNIHSSIDDNDPKLAAAQRIAGGGLAASSCTAGPCKVWDWSAVPQAESNFALQQSFQHQGVAFWWLDWCCDESIVGMPGLTPDSWIGHLYAQEMVNRGQRGFVLARIGSSNDYPQQVYAAGPWSDHTSAIAFTGDAWGTWNTLAREVALTPDEATIGQPYVSDDIGSFLGAPGGAPQVPADLYARWVQFGTFQPILRLHSANGNRLPWQFPQPARGIADDFLRLREALMPYTYTLASQAHGGGLPLAQPLYLGYPDQAAAYAYPGEYLYGSDVLVAPVTSPGDPASTTVWFPPGRWVDYFTGATFTGPTTASLSVPLSRMPVFVRGGGIIPEQSPATGPSTSSSSGSSASSGPLVLKVFSGSGGAFSLYGDSGAGLGYSRGQFTTTPITDAVRSTGPRGTATATGVTIGPSRGHYPGAPTAARYRLEMVDLTQPSQVTLNGHPLDRRPVGSQAQGWYYQGDAATVVVVTPSVPTDHALTVVASGGVPVDRPEPPGAGT
jgi:hypothetical protein